MDTSGEGGERETGEKADSDEHGVPQSINIRYIIQRIYQAAPSLLLLNMVIVAE